MHQFVYKCLDNMFSWTHILWYAITFYLFYGKGITSNPEIYSQWCLKDRAELGINPGGPTWNSYCSLALWVNSLALVSHILEDISLRSEGIYMEPIP